MKSLFRLKESFLMTVLLSMFLCNIHAQKKYISLGILQPGIEECTESPEGMNPYPYENVSIYPNPAEDFVTIHYQGTSRHLQIVIVDVTGRKVFEEKTVPTSDDVLISIGVIRFEGFYTLLVYDDSGIYSSHLIIH